MSSLFPLVSCTPEHTPSLPEGPASSEGSPLGKQMREGCQHSFDGFILVGGSELVTGIYGAPTIYLALFQSPGIYISLNIHSSSLMWVLP